MIHRTLKSTILNYLNPQHVIGLLGARRVGKTYLMQVIKKTIGEEKTLMVQGDNLDVVDILSSQRLSLLSQFVKGYNYLFIDEAQDIPNIGVSLKLLVDSTPNLSIFITGSSAFDIRNTTGAPLTGRSTFFNLYPFSQSELKENLLTARANLEERLIFGSYPQVYNAKSNSEKQTILEGIRNGYLLKDILMLDNLKDSKFIINLLRLIAFQIGHEVSYTELGRALNADNKTIKRYLDLLEKMFVIFSLNGFSKNIRKEYTKSPRYYFWDNGIRNAVISNFNPINLRNDVGMLWENYWIAERLKFNHYRDFKPNCYFWRTYDQKEVDYIEEINNEINGFELKWGKSKSKVSKIFTQTYNNSTVTTINKDNYLEYL